MYNEIKHDGFIFAYSKDDYLQIHPFTFITRTKPIDSHELGLKYHIITYKEDKDGNVKDLDHFEAIIGNPWYYIDSLISCNFLGAIFKKTRTSKKLANQMLNDLMNYNLITQEI
jgi:hypothetical protein